MTMTRLRSTAFYNDYFYRRNNQFWYVEAMKKLPKLDQATRMLVCAEDLGGARCVPGDGRVEDFESGTQSMPKDPSVVRTSEP